MEMFEEIIGYESIKKELAELCDIIKNKEKYERIGAKLPKGLLLHGKPGLGKTTMAKSFIKECGIKSYTLRKNKDSKSFIKEIEKVFKEAKLNSPSIIFLDDMDKFANEDEDHRNAEEYVAIQSGIDNVKDSEVFVIATTNDLNNLPNSLIRVGRFDRQITVQNPNEEDIKKIIIHYLKEKKVNKKVYDNIDDLIKVMTNHSCASLETILNEAIIKAAFDNRKYAELSDFINAVLKFEYKISDEFYVKSDERVAKTAIHEAGHALIAEKLLKGSVGLISIKKSGNSDTNGFIHTCKKLNDEQDIMVSLAGKAAVELIYPTEVAEGCYSDLKNVCEDFKDNVFNGKYGLDKYKVTRWFSDASSTYKEKVETLIQEYMIEKYNEVKRLLNEDKVILNNIAEELLEKEVLLSSELTRIIYGSC